MSEGQNVYCVTSATIVDFNSVNVTHLLFIQRSLECIYSQW